MAVMLTRQGVPTLPRLNDVQYWKQAPLQLLLLVVLCAFRCYRVEYRRLGGFSGGTGW